MASYPHTKHTKHREWGDLVMQTQSLSALTTIKRRAVFFVAQTLLSALLRPPAQQARSLGADRPDTNTRAPSGSISGLRFSRPGSCSRPDARWLVRDTTCTNEES